MDTPHCLTPQEICEYFEVDPAYGLTTQRASNLLKQFGSNELPSDPGTSLFTLLAMQFNDILIWVLMGAATISLLLVYFDLDSQDGYMAYVEPFVILMILFLNAVVGLIQESKAEKALQALKELQSQSAVCLRDGVWNSVSAKVLVPGDIIQVNVGDKIPADMRIISLKRAILQIEQSQLTGESSSVMKSDQALPLTSKNIELQMKHNLLFSSTTVSVGGAIGIVYSTGLNTEIGKIQSAVKEASLEEESTPLKKKLDEFAQMLTYSIAIICILVWIINYKNFFDPIHGSIFGGCIYYFKIAVALAVAAIPEGLPAVITTCLALGTKKMASKNAIVRKLPSVETLGCTSVICSDKTGTLTTNEMIVSCFYIPDSSPSQFQGFFCRGTEFSPVGEINSISGCDFKHIRNEDVAMRWFAKCAANCNDSKIMYSKGKYTRQGEPTEAALLALIEKLGCNDQLLNREHLQKTNRTNPMAFSNYWTQQSKLLATLDFTRERKSMSVICRELDSQSNVIYVKGAPESLLERSTSFMLEDGTIRRMNKDYSDMANQYIAKLAGQALRVLAFAVRFDCGPYSDYTGTDHPLQEQLKDYSNYPEIESNLTFLGFVGIIDPPRDEVESAIKRCRDAGIKVFMITGDNPLTAEAIAIQIGLSSPNVNKANWSITGSNFQKLSEQQQLQFLSNDGLVFSRMEPKQKQFVVRLLRSMGETVAVTGDGVNDAPALKMSHIGVSMGITGTEVAKEASDMILADDNFSTIVSAVQEGRSIYNNMKAFIRYLISSNIGEVISIFMTSALGIPEGLAPIQLLWVNLVTDGLPAIALGFNPPDSNVMRIPPRNRNEKLISNWVFFRYLFIGTYVGFATVFIFIWWYCFDVYSPDGHTIIPYTYLSNWNSCRQWENFEISPTFFFDGDSCSYFTQGKIKASTLSLTVLVVIEMLNAFNALSEYSSLLQMPPYVNPYLIIASAMSIIVHCVILYNPFMARIFGVVPLSLHDWYWVFIFSLPVIIIDEIAKYLARSTLPKASKTIKLQFSEISTSRKKD